MNMQNEILEELGTRMQSAVDREILANTIDSQIVEYCSPIL